MPIFEYTCSKCGKDFEEIAFDDMPVPCPYCGASETHKLMSTSARRPRSGADVSYTPSSGGCGGCSGGNCASCGH